MDSIGSKVTSKSLSKNSIFYLVYNILNVLFPFITGMYVARILYPNDIGRVAYAQNVVQYFVILSFLGIPTYGLREVARKRDNKEQLSSLYSELLVINFISTCFFIFLYTFIVFFVDRFRSDSQLYIVVGFSLVLNFLNNSWLYDGLEEFQYISIRNTIVKTISFICLVAFVREPQDYLKYAIITVLGTGGNYILNILNSRKYVKFRIHGLNLKQHLKPILFLVVVNIAIEIYTLVDTTMLGIIKTNENVAFYSYGSKINRICLQIINTFTMVIVPRITYYYKQNRTEEFNEMITKTLKVIIILSVPMIIGIQFVSEFAICKLYGDAYISSSYVLRILSGVLFFSPIGYLLGSRVMLVSGRENRMAICVCTGAVVNFVGNFFLIRYFGEVGAAIASLISEIVIMIIYINFGRRVFRLNKMSNTVIKVIISSGIMTFMLIILSNIGNEWIRFFTQVVSAITIYLIALLCLREELTTIYTKRILNKLSRRLKND